MTTGGDVRDLLSALLDGELDDVERARVEAALVDDPALARELRELAATRSLLRGLGAVEPPSEAADPGGATAGSIAEPVSLVDARRRRSPVVRALAAVASVAAAWVVVAAIGATIGRPATAPDVEAFASAHRTESMVGFESVDVDAMDTASFGDLDDLGDFDLRSVMRKGDVVYTGYSDGANDLSVFRERGRVDWGALPDDGTVQELAAGTTWQRTDGAVVVIVAERGDLVVTVVGDAAMGASVASRATAMLPPVDEQKSLWERLQDGPGDLLDRMLGR